MTEPELIARVRAGDRVAARALYDAHVRDVHRLAYRITGDPELADEVTQDTFVRALSHLDGFRGDSALGTWLYRITVTIALNAARRATRRRGRERPLEDADAVPVAAHDDRASHVDPIVRERLHRAIDALPEIYRTAVVLHELEGYSHVEIAAMLGVAVGTCKSRLFIARAQLRTALGDLAGDFTG